MRPARRRNGLALGLSLGLALVPTLARAQSPNPEELAAPSAPVAPPRTEALTLDPALQGPIVSVSVEPPLAGESPWTRTGLAPGSPFTAAAAREALRVALASGTFAEARLSARAVPGGVALVVRGERRYRLRAVSLVGVARRSLDEVQQDLSLRSSTFVTEASVAAALRRVEAAYHDAGYPDARALPTWRETDDPGTRVLRVEVEERTPVRVVSTRIEGAPTDLREALTSALGLSAGGIADPRRARAAVDPLREALRRRGYLEAQVEVPRFDPVDGDAARVAVVVMVTPGPRYSVQWQGVRSFDAADLTAALRLDEERNFDGATLSAVLSRVREYYHRRGFVDATAQAVTLPEADGQRTLRITVREGLQAFVRAVTFPGASAFTPRELLATVTGYLEGELPSSPRPYTTGRLDRGHTYTPETMAEAARRIVLRYQERGFLDARVATPVLRRVPDPRGPWTVPPSDDAGEAREVRRPDALEVEMRVTEGAQTFVEELGFEGNRAQPSATLARVGALSLGVPLSHRAVDEARVRLTEHYQSLGYAFVQVEPEVERSPDHSRARIRVRLREGPRVRIAAIVIRNVGSTPDSVVRTRLTLREGGWYTQSALRTSQRRLSELGIFSGVNISLEDPELETALKTVVVQLTERPPQSLELRGGFTTGQGLRAGFEYQHLNVLDRAISFTLRAQGGVLIPIPGLTPEFPPEAQPTFSQLLNWRVTASVGVGYVPFLGYGWGSALDVSTVRVLQPPFYALTTNGVGVSILNRSLPGTAFTFTGEIQNVNTTLFGARSIEQLIAGFVDRCLQSNPSVSSCTTQRDTLRQQLLRTKDGDSLLGALRFGAAFDRRDSAFNPTRGWYVGATAELLRVLSVSEEDQNLARTTLHLSGRASLYTRVTSGGTVLLTSLRVGRNLTLFGTQPNTHPSRLFWLGGADSMRGWLQNQMVPQDVADSALTLAQNDRDRRLLGANGSEFFWNLVVDLRVPLGICVTNGVCLALGLFCDIGNLWSRPPGLDELYRARFSPGFGLRTTSPFGIISLDVGFNPLYRAYIQEQLWALQFSLGSV